MIIEKHEKLYGKESGKAYFQVTIEGKKYNHFKPEWFVDFKEGQKCEATFKEDGQYTNIVSLSMELNGPVNAPVEKVPSTNVQSEFKGQIAKETGVFQSTVWNHQVAANSYEWGIYPKAGEFYEKHKIYYETEGERLAMVKAIKESDSKMLGEKFKPEHMLDMSTAART